MINDDDVNNTKVGIGKDLKPGIHHGNFSV